MSVGDEGSSGRIHPHRLPRIGILIPTGVLAIAFTVGAYEHPTPESLTEAVIIAAASLFVAARWMLFAGIRRRGDHVIVTGLLWSRRIPLQRIDRVTTGYARIHWRARSGARLITPVTSLWSNPNPTPAVTRYNNERLRILRAWVREARGSGRPRWMDDV